MWGNATTSILLEASTTGVFQLYQKLNTTLSIVADIKPISSTFYSDVNIPSGRTYKINNDEYLTTKNTNDIIQGTTDKQYSLTLAQADAKIAILSTDSTDIDFTYITGNITAIFKNNTIDISRLKTAQIDTANTASTLILRDATGSFSANAISAGSLIASCHGYARVPSRGGIWEWARRGTWEAEAPGSPSAYRPPDPGLGYPIPYTHTDTGL